MTVKYIEQMLQEPLQRMKKQVFKHRPSIFQLQNCSFYLIAALLMVLLFSSLAKSYAKNGGAKGPGRIFEPLVVYIRDEILFLILERKTTKIHELFINDFFFVLFLNIFGLTPLGLMQQVT
jgi:F-type H+-transporting ATPase subunit a